MKMKLKVLVGNGRKIGLLVAPFLLVGVILNVPFPSLFSIGGPANVLKVISILVLVPGAVIWF
jgi:hypothetical protein